MTLLLIKKKKKKTFLMSNRLITYRYTQGRIPKISAFKYLNENQYQQLRCKFFATFWHRFGVDTPMGEAGSYYTILVSIFGDYFSEFPSYLVTHTPRTSAHCSCPAN